ncbi:MAG: potassium-transporting ATPase subunit KdpA, partial [Nitrososphaerota archaeon]|nr:potassium-transporting ATPase subunit KdpA [Nitrososphaerota archaeon]
MDYPSAAIQLVAVFVGSLGLAILFSRFLARMVSSEKAPVSKRLARIEQLVFRLFGVDPNRQMGWREYTVSLLVTNVVVAIFVAVILGIQGYLPFAPPGLGNLSPDLIFNTASSFITNTDLQHYAGELQLSVFSQMVAITFVMFVAPATA